MGYSADGSWLWYDNIDFGKRPECGGRCLGQRGLGGTLEFNLDSASGPTVARLPCR